MNNGLRGKGSLGKGYDTVVKRVKGDWNWNWAWIIRNRLLISVHAIHGSGNDFRCSRRIGRGKRFRVSMHAMHGWGLVISVVIVGENLNIGVNILSYGLIG